MKKSLTRALGVALALTAGTTAFAGTIEAGDHMEMAEVLKAPVSPTRAVQIAESGGGRAYDYGMEATPNGHWYDVAVLRGSDKLALRIDASTGKVIGSGPAHGEAARGARALEGSGLTFAHAIATAERVGGGPALEANAAGHGAHAYVDVDVIQDRGKRIAHYRVAMRDGQPHATLTGTDS